MVKRLDFTTEFILFACLLGLALAEYNCEYKKDGYYSDEDFCHVYWRCNYGVAEEYECPAGTAWNHVEMKCDWLDNVDCARIDENGKKQEKDEDEEEKEEVTKKPKKNNKKEKTEVVEPTEDEAENDLNNDNVVPDDEESSVMDNFDYDDLCSNVSATAGFRYDPFVCNRYIRCNHGYAQKFICYKNTAWDIEKNMCLWANEVKCGDRQMVDDEKLLGKNDSDEKMKKNGTRTTKSTTIATTALKLNSTIKNLLNNITLMEPGQSDKPTTGNNTPLCQAFGSYFVQDNTNCASYFMCNNGKETKMSCSDKQLYNADSSQCEDFQLVFCGSRPVSTADKNQCSSKRDGIYPDLDRACRVFFQCVAQQKVREASCPNQLKFNSVSSRCDNPANIPAPCGTYAAPTSEANLTHGSSKLLSQVVTLLMSIYLMKKCVI